MIINFLKLILFTSLAAFSEMALATTGLSFWHVLIVWYGSVGCIGSIFLVGFWIYQVFNKKKYSGLSSLLPTVMIFLVFSCISMYLPYITVKDCSFRVNEESCARMTPSVDVLKDIVHTNEMVVMASAFLLIVLVGVNRILTKR